jgi:hypothetical protein
MHVKQIFFFVAAAVLAVCASSTRSPAQTYTGLKVIVGGAEYQVCAAPKGCTDPNELAWVDGLVYVYANGAAVASASYGQGSTTSSVSSSLCSSMSGSSPLRCTANSNGVLSVQASAKYSISTSCTAGPKVQGYPPRCAFSAGYQSAGKVDPLYTILAVLYDPPGIGSTNGYSDSTTYGTTTTIGSSFQAGTTTTYTLTEGVPGFTSTNGWSFGFSTVTGNLSAFTWSVSQGQGVANKHNGTSNAIDHTQDLFVLWINPEVTITQTGTNKATYSVSTPVQAAGQPSPGEPHTQDIVEVYANELQNPSLIPLTVLKPITLATGEALPGLSNICAHPLPPAQCTQANACGCVPTDFTAILAADPILNFAKTANPTTVNNPPSNIHYDLIYSAELLQGPGCTGCNNPPNTFTASDSTQTVDTTSQGYSYSVGFSSGLGFGNIATLGWSMQVTTTDTFTWSNTESVGTINGQMHQMQVSLTSPTIDCSEYDAVYEDLVYHTFAFQEPTGNNSCP